MIIIRYLICAWFKSGFQSNFFCPASLFVDLNLSQNLFTGTLPTDLGDLTRLSKFSVYYAMIVANRLKKCLTIVAEIVTKETLLVHDNLFTGAVPDDYVFLGQLGKLRDAVRFAAKLWRALTMIVLLLLGCSLCYGYRFGADGQE